jgi:transcriptional antiterminator NusG
MPDELPPTATPETQTDPESSDVENASQEVPDSESTASEQLVSSQPDRASVQEAASEGDEETGADGNQELMSASSVSEAAPEMSEPSSDVVENSVTGGASAQVGDDDDDLPDAPVEVPEPASTDEGAEPPQENKKHWYVVKVQSGREDSIKAAIERKVRIERLEEYFGKIIIPVERVEELRRGKRVYKSIKLYPGYLFAEVEFNDRILYLFREVSGVGDFVGGGPLGKAPTPMRPEEVERMINRQPTAEKPGEEGTAEKPREVVRARPRFSVGDRLKVCDGNFAGMEGEVIDITDDKVKLQVLVLGMPVTIDLEFWQVESL